ncbi:MAG: hypothetical protein CMJ46_12080 [Planctomyces sp.]|nr:hypothetical protein [Planctomyces sp.]
MAGPRKPRSTTSATKSAEARGPSPFLMLALGTCGLAWMLRWLTITEGAIGGETLWITLLWLLAAALLCWADFRERRTGIAAGSNDEVGADRRTWSFDPISLGLMLIVAGHVAGCAWLYSTGGQLRAAVNLCWEWIGLGTTWWILCRVVARLEWRRDLIALILASALPLACVGLWQHYIWYESTSQEYLQQKEIYLQLRNSDSSQWTQQDREDFQTAQAFFKEQGIPEDPDVLQSWENRLLGSREPLGFFALTNSYAALLLFLLGGWIALLFTRIETRSSQSWIAPFVVVALICFVLLLTKSRSAWLALLLTAGALLISRFSKRWWRVTLLGGGLVIGLVAVAWLTGAIDTEVFSEAPRSLRYRFTYWTATAELLQDSPFFGSGPGNFRHAYLRHRPGGASEEIADPHQFLLDLWANGGLLALLGIGLIVFGLLLYWRRGPVSDIGESNASSPALPPLSARQPILVGGIIACFWVGGMYWLNFSGLEWPALFTGLGTVVALVLLKRFAAENVDQLASEAHRFSPWLLLAILIHLSASGGIEMPGIVQTLLLCLALMRPQASLQVSVPARTLALAGLLSSVILMGLLYRTAWLPVQQAAWQIELAEEAIAYEESPDVVIAHFEEAARADSLDPHPLKLQGDYRLSEFVAEGRWDLERLQDIERVYDQALARDPRNPWRYIDLGRAWQEAYQFDQGVVVADEAIRYFRQGLELYPSSAELWALYALLLEETGDRFPEKVESAATEALRLDELNKLAGHSDQRLDSALRERLKQLVDGTSE